MKLPRVANRRVHPASLERAAATSRAAATYELLACTTNLGASASHPGDPSLPHCLIHIRDAAGRRLRSISLGRGGLGPERDADVPSGRCEDAPVRVSAAELRSFEHALQRCADEGYAWGERDCCSCLDRAFTQGLGRPTPAAIRRAAAAIAAVPDPQRRRSST